MLEYPDDFNIPTFRAGPFLASSRAFGVWVMVVLFLIIISCGLLLWVQHSVHIHPFLVSVNPITGQWEIVGHHHSGVHELKATQALQESVVGKFVRDWFTISSQSSANASLWSVCDRSRDCELKKTVDVNMGVCSLYCLSGDDIFSQFLDTVVPGYQLRAANGETWHLDMASLQISPMASASGKGTSWQVRAVVYSNMSAPINVLGYAVVQQNQDLYPQTMGYYVQDFSAYKMN